MYIQVTVTVVCCYVYSPVLVCVFRMAQASIDKLKEDTGVTEEQLSRQISDDSLIEIARRMSNWRGYATVLKLEPGRIQHIINQSEDAYWLKAHEVLKAWKAANVFEATYRNLVRVALGENDSAFAKAICQESKR